MQCANCGTPAQPGDVFCGVCGADLSAQAAAPSAAPVMPQPPVEPQVAAAPQPAPHAAAATQPTPRRSRVPLVIGIVVGGLLLSCLCVAVAGFALFAPLRQVITEVQEIPSGQPQEAPAPEPETPATPSGYATAEEAVSAELPPDWVLRMISEDDSRAEYWAGPPASEYTTVYIAEKGADGSWSVTSAEPLELMEP